MYDALVAGEVLWAPLGGDTDFQATVELLLHPHVKIGLGDGGAHLGLFQEAGCPTFMLSHYARDRGAEQKPRISLELAVYGTCTFSAQCLVLSRSNQSTPEYALSPENKTCCGFNIRAIQRHAAIGLSHLLRTVIFILKQSPLNTLKRQMQTSDTAKVCGLLDRGIVAVGMKADLNVIDLATLNLEKPAMVSDLPTGAKRWMQASRGYKCTVLVYGPWILLC
jgi:N-acyl-D-aspartate/D-glutamate deacylase